MCVNILYLDHGGNGMNPVHVPHEALGQVSYTQTNGPVGVTLQSDHLIRTERHIDTMTPKNPPKTNFGLFDVLTHFCYLYFK